MRKQGFTLMEVIVVLILIGIAAVMVLNFSNPNEKALATVARNNLLAIYSAQQNYNTSINNNQGYCLNTANSAQANCTAISGTVCANNLAAINCNLSLAITDDNSYTYACSPQAFTNTPLCQATRNNTTGQPLITLYLNEAILSTNPVCAGGTQCP